jgi:hypothetical protein
MALSGGAHLRRVEWRRRRTHRAHGMLCIAVHHASVCALSAAAAATRARPPHQAERHPQRASPAPQRPPAPPQPAPQLAIPAWARSRRASEATPATSSAPAAVPATLEAPWRPLMPPPARNCASRHLPAQLRAPPRRPRRPRGGTSVRRGHRSAMRWRGRERTPPQTAARTRAQWRRLPARAAPSAQPPTSVGW